jgi:glycosyltransferase involved in cell wall biosynthesis
LNYTVLKPISFLNPKIVILYDYFLPAFKAGGPIQSIANLIRNLDTQFEIYVISSNLDLGCDIPLDVETNTWQDFENGKANVIYLTKENITISHIKKIIKEISPDKIFVNGIYSIPFSIAPAYYFSNIAIIHVRGMLHPGALDQKAIKKKIFLGIFKLLSLHKKIRFCVSDQKEKEYTQAIFGKISKINIAQNFPASFDVLPANSKETGTLNLMSIALISPMKNHLLVLEALTLVKNSITWYIYGPIKDKTYWGNCEKLISQLPPNIKVKYMGDINPTGVYNALATCDLFILPSQSENFGHALYEAMIAGKPIITSHNTPWNLLEENNAGYNVNLSALDISNAIESAALLNQIDYNQKVKAVAIFARNAVNINEIKNQYLALFSK